MIRSLVRLLPFYLAAAAATAGPVPIGILSYDEFIPAGSTPGIHAFNVANLTGAYSLPPDFPAASELTLLSAALTLFPESAASFTLDLGDVLPGFLLDAFFSPLIQVPSDVFYTSATFTATVAGSPFLLADGSTVVPTSTIVSAALLPSAGGRLAPGDFAPILLDTQDYVPTAVPEPGSLALLAVPLALCLYRRRKRRGSASLTGALLLWLAMLHSPASAQTPAAVTLSAATLPAAGQPGVTTLDVTGSGFPAGVILPARVTLSLSPVTTGPAMTATATAVTTVAGTLRRVTFRFTGASVTAPANYNLALSGVTESGATFASSNRARLIVNPPAAITLAPAAATAGAQSVAVTITGQYTNFLNGSTSANFGPGITVNGGAAATLARITVTSPTSATATLALDTAAPTGARQIIVATGLQQATATFTVNAAAPTNQPPSANAGPDQTRLLNSIATLTGAASSDPENQPLTYTWTLTSKPAGSNAGLSSLTAAQPTLPLDRVGQYIARLVVSDGQLSSAPDEVIVTVPANGPPELSAISSRTVALGTSFTLRLAATDPDPQDTLTYSLPTAPAGASFNPQPLLKWTPQASQLGPQNFTVRVQDNHGNFHTRSFTVTVVNTNGAPLFDALPDETISAGGAFTRQLTAQDPNPSDTLTYALASGPSGMTIAGRQLSWTPNTTQLGDATVRVRVTDAGGLSGYGQFVVTVKTVLPPVAVDDSYEVSLGQLLTVATPGVLINDANPNPGALTANRLTNPDKGSASLSTDGALAYTPPVAPAGPALAVTRKAAQATPFPGGTIPGGRTIVADFTGDGTPESMVLDVDRLWIYSGDTATPLLRIDNALPVTGGLQCAIRAFSTTGGTQWAAADIDDDGKIEIVGPARCSVDSTAASLGNIPADRLFAIVYDSSRPEAYRVKWISSRLSTGDLTFQQAWIVGNTPGFAEDSSVTIARLASNETPSILVGRTYSGAIFGIPCSSAGAQYTNPNCRIVQSLNGATGAVRQVYHANPAFMNSNNLYGRYMRGGYMAPVVADIDNDGSLDILYQGTLWNRSGTVLRQFDGVNVPGGTTTQYSFPLDLDGDPEMEIVTHNIFRDQRGELNDTSFTYIKAFQPNGTLIWQLAYPGSPDFISPVSAADVDRDGIPEIIFGFVNQIWVIDSRTGQIRYIKDLPNSSGEAYFAASPGATLPVYDLNGDGIVDMVVQQGVNDISILRADNGETQATYQIPGASFRGDGGCCVPVISGLGAGGQATVSWTRRTGLGGGDDFFSVMGGSAGAPWRTAPRQFNQSAYWGSNFNANGSVPLTYVRHTTDPRTNLFQQQPPDPYAPGFVGAEQTSFTYSAISQGLASNPATVRIGLINNRKPVFTSVPPRAMVTNSSITYDARAVDPDPADTVTYSLAVNGLNLGSASINPTSGRLTVSGADPRGALFLIAASDNRGGVAYQTVTLQSVNGVTTVPGVTGLTQAAASTAIATANLTVGNVDQVFSATAAGVVLSQSPAAGAVVPQQEGVHIVVSKGQAPIVVPNLIGQPGASAQTTVSSLGFTPAVTRVFSATVPAGEVIAQAPAGGTLLAPPAAVSLTVSAGNGLVLQLSRSFTTADAPIMFSVLATDESGTPIAAPPLVYSVATLLTPSAGPLPTVSGNSILPDTATRGSFRITGTHTASGRTVVADFVVVFPRTAGKPSMMNDYAELTAAMADIDALARQGKAALAAGNTTLIRSLLKQMVTRWRQVNRRGLLVDSPLGLENGFFPTPDQSAGFGLSATPDDLLMHQVRLDAAADLKEFADALRAPGTPMSEL
ncbi:MAG: PASTA domain-containing protein, partial [Bryobacterales bacterium]|nr:PASTA domain-containing protein [Bryobacterales bacterium]